jgi:hypothetical protein
MPSFHSPTSLIDPSPMELYRNGVYLLAERPSLWAPPSPDSLYLLSCLYQTYTVATVALQLSVPRSPRFL